MRLLLDTHVLLWLAEDSARLTAAARRVIGDENSLIHVSLATIWEIAIKQAKGKLPGDVREMLEDLPDAFAILPITAEHVVATRDLPLHHGDPFDRLLIAQARIERLTLVTHDDAFKPYGVPILWT